MLNLKRYPAINKYLSMKRYPNIALSNKSAIRNLWSDTWHKVGIEWPKNQLPGAKFKNSVFHADSSSLDAICKVAEECEIKLINRPTEDEIELIAPGAENFSVIISQDHYDDRLNYDYSDLEGLSITEAINVLTAKLNNERISFDYIFLRFKTPSEFTGLRTKILVHPPESNEFREFLIAAKSKLEATAETLQGAADMIDEPVRSKVQEEREAIARSFEERCAMMRKRRAFLNSIVSQFNSFDEFTRAKSEWCSVIGISITKCVNYLEITINLVDGNYETYFAVPSNDGHLTISEIIGWQDDYCANSFLNIITQKKADEDEILN